MDSVLTPYQKRKVTLAKTRGALTQEEKNEIKDRKLLDLVKETKVALEFILDSLSDARAKLEAETIDDIFGIAKIEEDVKKLLKAHNSVIPKPEVNVS